MVTKADKIAASTKGFKVSRFQGQGRGNTRQKSSDKDVKTLQLSNAVLIIAIIGKYQNKGLD